MPIAGYKPTKEPIQQANLPAVVPDNNKPVIHDDKKIPLHALVAYVEGSPWTLDQYYSQITTEHTDLREVDPEEPNIYQQYLTIHNLEIKVDSALQPSYDQETGITTTVGGANVYASVIPNAADYFVAQAFGQEKALYRVVSVERKSFQHKSVYHIDYVLIGYVGSTAAALAQSLKEKSIRDMYFDRDRLIDGKQTTVRLEDHETHKKLIAGYRDIVQNYFRFFFNRRYMTLLLPGQESAIYDPHLVLFLLSVVDTDDSNDVKNVRMPPTDHNLYLNQETIWDAMQKRNYNLIANVHQKMAMVARQQFLSLSFGKGAHYSSMDYFVYCKTPDESYNIKETPKPFETQPLTLIQTENRHGTLASLLTERYTDGTVNAQILYPFMVDDYYVLSANFYNDTANKSLLEICVKDYLKRLTINLKYLLKIIEVYPTWSRLEQFYYGPVIMTLIKQTVKEQYT